MKDMALGVFQRGAFLLEVLANLENRIVSMIVFCCLHCFPLIAYIAQAPLILLWSASRSNDHHEKGDSFWCFQR